MNKITSKEKLKELQELVKKALDWNRIHAGKISQEEIKRYVNSEDCQKIKRKLKEKVEGEGL